VLPDDTRGRVADASRGPLREIAALFLKLGTIGFGGPAAHIALMRDEVVSRRGWVSDERFLDLLGAANLIPGPNSTELAIHLGYIRGGWRGLLVAGSLFILPAMLIVMSFAWAYVEYGTTPGMTWLLYGVKPVIIAVVLQALWGLSRSAVKGALHAAVATAVVALYLLGFNEIAILFGGGLLVMLIRNGRRIRFERVPAVLLAPLASAITPALAGANNEKTSFSLLTLFLTFLKIGAVLYGSGYVLLAFLRNDFVVRLGWLTNQQLLDAVAVGQVTPGPVFTTATFIGYVLDGVPGAIVATVAIFLPSFCFVAASAPLVPRLRRSPWMASFLDGVNVAALGLMAAVTWTLGKNAIVDVPTAVLGVVAAVLLIRFRVNSAWVVIGGGLLGILYRAVGG
jgi:chromate transporter